MKKKIQNDLVKRITATIVLFLSLNLIAISVQAHNPHDMVAGLGVSPDFANDQTLFLATDGALTGWRYQDILRSTDGGATWTNLPNGMDNLFDISVIRISPGFSNDHTLYVATSGGGVYQSSDRGNSWHLFNTGLRNLNIKKLEIAGSKNSDYVLFLSLSGGSLYRRSIAQTEWTRVLDNAADIAVIAASPDFSQDATVMTADGSGHLRISTDRGINWIDMGNPTGTKVYDMAIAPGNAKEIFLAAGNGIFYSNDSGNTFISKSVNLPNEEINNVAISPNYLIDRTLFCTSKTQAVYKSTDNGDSWVFHKSGAVITGQTPILNEFSELQISSTFSTDQTIFLAAFDGLFVSTNGGSMWTEKQTRINLITGLAFSPYFIDDQRVIATTYHGGAIYTSADRGTTWSLGGKADWPFPDLAMSIFDVDFVQNHTGSTPIAVASRNNSYLGFSSNFGENWNVLSIPKFAGMIPAVYINVFALSPNFDTDQEIYFGTRTHGVVQTMDGGNNWRMAQGIPTSSQITSVVVSPNYANDQTAFAANRAGEVWRTIDRGNSWLRVGTNVIISRGWPKQNYMWIAISPHFAIDRLVLVGTNNGIYRSNNAGFSWKPMLSPIVGSGAVIQQIEFSPNFSNDQIVFVTIRGKGLYRLKLDNNGKVVASRNVGAWLLENNIQFTEFRTSPSFAQDATLLGASREDIYISTNGGLTWAVTGKIPISLYP